MPNPEERLLFRIDDPASAHHVWIEDDGDKAYAYLAAGSGEFLGDVWLYNRENAPAEPPWEGGAEGPFVNAAKFVRAGMDVEPVERQDEIAVNWGRSTELGTVARIHIRGMLHAILRTGSSPGWCVLAADDGPVARRLSPGCELEPV